MVPVFMIRWSFCCPTIFISIREADQQDLAIIFSQTEGLPTWKFSGQLVISFFDIHRENVLYTSTGFVQQG
jgi:hypothetical protein